MHKMPNTDKEAAKVHKKVKHRKNAKTVVPSAVSGAKAGSYRDNSPTEPY